MSLGDRLRHHLDDRPWRLLLSSVDLAEVFDPGQIPLRPSRDFLRVPEQDRNPIDAKLRQVLAFRALIDPRSLYSIGAYRALPSHVLPR
jgi:hypothetical protein